MAARESYERQDDPGSLAGTLLPELERTEENQRIDDIFAGVRGEWAGIIDGMRRNPLQCAIDGHIFSEFENLGRWECAQHACALEQADKTHPRDYYPCCGREGFRAPGCVPADHRLHYAPYGSLPKLEIPANVFNRVVKVFGEPKKTQLVFNRVVIDRFDKAEALLRLSKSGRQE